MGAQDPKSKPRTGAKARAAKTTADAAVVAASAVETVAEPSVVAEPAVEAAEPIVAAEPVPAEKAPKAAKAERASKAAKAEKPHKAAKAEKPPKATMAEKAPEAAKAEKAPEAAKAEKAPKAAKAKKAPKAAEAEEAPKAAGAAQPTSPDAAGPEPLPEAQSSEIIDDSAGGLALDEDAPLAPLPQVPEALRTPQPEPEIDLPVARGRDFLSAMPRDPESVFLYWELTGEGIERAQAALARPDTRLVLRVYLMPESAAADSAEAEVRDLPIDAWIGRYALELQRPGLRIVAAIGLRAEGDAGAFAHIVRAAAVSLPRRWPSGGAVRFSRVPDQTEADATLAAMHPSRRPAPRPEGALPAPVWVGEAQEVHVDTRRADRLPAGFGAPLPEYLALGGGRGSRPVNTGAPVPAGSNHPAAANQSGSGPEGNR